MVSSLRGRGGGLAKVSRAHGESSGPGAELDDVGIPSRLAQSRFILRDGTEHPLRPEVGVDEYGRVFNNIRLDNAEHLGVRLKTAATLDVLDERVDRLVGIFREAAHDQLIQRLASLDDVFKGRNATHYIATSSSLAHEPRLHRHYLLHSACGPSSG